MSDHESPAAIADGALLRFDAALRTRDLAKALRLFDEEASLYGSEEGETAHGHGQLTEFFQRSFVLPYTFGWKWREPIAQRLGDVVWFVAEGEFDPSGDHAPAATSYRLSGVLHLQSGSWVFHLFNGAEPVEPDE